MNEAQRLEAMAQEFLNAKGISKVADFLVNDELLEAREYLLLVIDINFCLGEISEDEAREHYAFLAIPPDRACQIRQTQIEVDENYRKGWLP